MRKSRFFENENGEQYEVRCEYYNSVGTPMRWKICVKKKSADGKFVHIGSSESKMRKKKIFFHDYEAYHLQEYLNQIPMTWIVAVIDDVCAEIRKLAIEKFK